MSDDHKRSDDRTTLDRRQLLRLGAFTAGALALGRPSTAFADVAGTSRPDRSDRRVAEDGAEVPLACFELARTLVRTTPGFTTPVAGRTFGYAGVALYARPLICRPGLHDLTAGIGPCSAISGDRRGSEL